MIKIKRSARPAILQRKARQWTLDLLNAHTKINKSKAEKKYRHKQIRQALEALFHGKCAYCESQVKHIAYPHIEHYRPKRHFPCYTFVWHNLLLACGVCNGAAHKGDKFPDKSEGGLLLNPCRDNPAEHLRFYFDFNSKLASVYGVTTRGKTTVEYLSLNRPELKTHRSNFVMMLACIRQFAAQGDPEAQQLFLEAQQDCAEYAAFARALAEQTL